MIKLLDIRGVVDLFGLSWSNANKRKIIRLLLKIQEDRKITILTKITWSSSDKKGKSEIYYTTEDLIRQALPEFFPQTNVDEIQSLKQKIDSLTKRILVLEKA